MNSTYQLPKLRILFAEDVSIDREMVERLLRQNNIAFVSECVDTEPDFVRMLRDFNPDIILSDYRMPTFDGMKALKITMEMRPDIPFIILTGSINEDIAVECMRNGADDYIIKQNLKRLIPSIVSAMEKKSLKRSEVDALRQLKSSDAKYRMLIEQSIDAIFMVFRGRIIYVNHNFEALFGITAEEVMQEDFPLASLLQPGCNKQIVQVIQPAIDNPGTSIDVEMKLALSNGKVLVAEIAFSSFEYNDEIAYQGVIHDITERKILMERNVLLSRAVEQSPVSIVLTDANASIEYVNPIFEQRTGYSFEEAVGQNPRILQSGYHSKAFYQQMWEVLANGKTWQGELKNRTKAGEVLWESVSISPIFNEMGSVEHFVGVKEDITSRIETLEELRLAKEKAEESNRLKSAFLATMSHELRTPLNQIIGFSEIIPKLTQDESIVDFAKQINKSGNELFALIEDIFQMAMVEHSPVLLRRNKVEIGQIIRLLNESLHEIVQVSGKLEFLETSVEVEPGLESKVIVIDKPKVIQAVTQLIRNAVKFTSNGFVRIRVSLSDDLLLSIAVADSGIGIPENKLDIIFDFFRQADESLTRVYGGVGIGLALSKKIAEALNANIYVETKVNEGSTFTFVVPVENGTSE